MVRFRHISNRNNGKISPIKTPRSRVNTEWTGDFPPVWVFTAVLMAGLPTATNVFVLAQQYQVWTERASAAVLTSTTASVVTVTLLLYAITKGYLPADLFPG